MAFRLITARAFKIKEDSRTGSDMVSEEVNLMMNDFKVVDKLGADELEKQSSTTQSDNVERYNAAGNMIEQQRIRNGCGVWSEFGKPYRANGAPDLDLGSRYLSKAAHRSTAALPLTATKSTLTTVGERDTQSNRKDSMTETSHTLLPALVAHLAKHTLHEIDAEFEFPRAPIMNATIRSKKSRSGVPLTVITNAGDKQTTVVGFTAPLHFTRSTSNLNSSLTTMAPLDGTFLTALSQSQPPIIGTRRSSTVAQPDDSSTTLPESNTTSDYVPIRNTGRRPTAAPEFQIGVDAASSPNDNIIHPSQKIVPQVMVSIVRSAALAASDIRSPMSLADLNLDVHGMVQINQNNAGFEQESIRNIGIVSKLPQIRPSSADLIVVDSLPVGRQVTSLRMIGGENHSIPQLLQRPSQYSPRQNAGALVTNAASVIQNGSGTIGVGMGKASTFKTPLSGQDPGRVNYRNALQQKLANVAPETFRTRTPIENAAQLAQNEAVAKKEAAQKRNPLDQAAVYLKENPVQRWRQQFLVAKADLRIRLDTQILTRQHERSDIIGNPTLLANAASLILHRTHQPLDPAYQSFAAAQPTMIGMSHSNNTLRTLTSALAEDNPDSTQSTVLQKRSSIWEEAKHLSDKKLNEEKAEAIAVTKRQFMKRVTGFIEDLATRGRLQTSEVADLVSHMRRLLELGYPLDKYIFPECLHFLGKRTFENQSQLHVLRFLYREFSLTQEDLWTFVYQVGWKLPLSVEDFLMRDCKT